MRDREGQGTARRLFRFFLGVVSSQRQLNLAQNLPAGLDLQVVRLLCVSLIDARPRLAIPRLSLPSRNQNVDTPRVPVRKLALLRVFPAGLGRIENDCLFAVEFVPGDGVREHVFDGFAGEIRGDRGDEIRHVKVGGGFVFEHAEDDFAGGLGGNDDVGLLAGDWVLLHEVEDDRPLDRGSFRLVSRRRTLEAPTTIVCATWEMYPSMWAPSSTRTASPFFSKILASVSEGSGDKWQTKVEGETQVGKAMPSQEHRDQDTSRVSAIERDHLNEVVLTLEHLALVFALVVDLCGLVDDRLGS